MKNFLPLTLLLWIPFQCFGYEHEGNIGIGTNHMQKSIQFKHSFPDEIFSFLNAMQDMINGGRYNDTDFHSNLVNCLNKTDPLLYQECLLSPFCTGQGYLDRKSKNLNQSGIQQVFLGLLVCELSMGRIFQFLTKRRIKQRPVALV